MSKKLSRMTQPSEEKIHSLDQLKLEVNIRRFFYLYHNLQPVL